MIKLMEKDIKTAIINTFYMLKKVNERVSILRRRWKLFKKRSILVVKEACSTKYYVSTQMNEVNRHTGVKRALNHILWENSKS